MKKLILWSMVFAEKGTSKFLSFILFFFSHIKKLKKNSVSHGLKASGSRYFFFFFTIINLIINFYHFICEECINRQTVSIFFSRFLLKLWLDDPLSWKFNRILLVILTNCQYKKIKICIFYFSWVYNLSLW